MPARADTIIDLLQRGRDRDVAILAPGRPALTYRSLRTQVLRTIDMLNGLGVSRGDTVASVLPNGPEAASAFVAIAAAACVAPLNPAYRREEFEFYLADLRPRLLIVSEGQGTAAREVARLLGIAVASLQPEIGGEAGRFDLVADRRGEGGVRRRDGVAGDVALILHTSGTTSRPKMVPLTHANLCASAIHIADSLGLTPEDRCLNIMPLFHIHGLMASVLASLASGASVCCAPSFNAHAFFAWMQETAPTWYSAVPALHQVIADRAARHRDVIASARLRLVRSCSAPLSGHVMRAVERTFGVPVIEAYGMTEAAHQITSNPLPPGAAKPGTVGIPAGPEVAVAGEAGQLLPPGHTGEVVIRGPNVTPGYLNAADANAAAFVDGWLRTGDQGVFDEDGYLRLTGRLKELINRAGEKISPIEVEHVVIDHPAVSQAVVFAVPDDALGEDVAAAVVLEQGTTATEREIRAFVAERLAGFKVPRRVVFVDAIPKGPTGKIQRRGLAASLQHLLAPRAARRRAPRRKDA